MIIGLIQVPVSVIRAPLHYCCRCVVVLNPGMYALSLGASHLQVRKKGSGELDDKTTRLVYKSCRFFDTG